MRRLLRWAFNLAPASSIPLFVATAATWPVNRGHFERVSFSTGDQHGCFWRGPSASTPAMWHGAGRGAV